MGTTGQDFIKKYSTNKCYGNLRINNKKYLINKYLIYIYINYFLNKVQAQIINELFINIKCMFKIAVGNLTFNLRFIVVELKK